MIYLTGDCHGDFHRFSSKKFKEGTNLTKDDFLIILGDAALKWDDSKEENYWLDYLESKPFTILNIGGNHENYDLLDQYPEIPFHGGYARQLRSSVYELSRGYVFHLCELKIFCMGGAQTHDVDFILPNTANKEFKRMLRTRGIAYRIAGKNWWKNEIPTNDEYKKAMEQLQAANWKVDIILTHCAPDRIQKRIAKEYPHNVLTKFLDSMMDSVQYYKWFCGHYHKQWHCPTERFQVLNEEILLLPKSM